MKIRIVLGVILFFSLNIYAQIGRGGQDAECFSKFKIYDFKLHQNAQSPAPSYPWKVVVGLPIEYRARPEKGSLWLWELGAGPDDNFIQHWDLQSIPVPQTFRDRSNEIDLAIIPNSKLPIAPFAPLIFGDAFGKVKAQKKLDNLPDPVTTFETKPKDNKVKVYYQKDQPNHNDPSVPNWFYYWSALPKIQSLLTIPGFMLMNEQTCEYDIFPTELKLRIEYDGVVLPYSSIVGTNNTYGQNHFKASNGAITLNNCPDPDPVNLATVSYPPEFSKIVIGEGCGFKKPSVDGKNTLTGIHVFYSTVVHEVEHAIIQCDVWQFWIPGDNSGVLPGYNTAWDKDNDGYKDLWETESMEGKKSGFKIHPRYDPQNPNAHPTDKYQKYTPQNLATSTTGTIFEEKRCRAKEASLKLDELDLLDWSYDPKNVAQGKQWNAN